MSTSTEKAPLLVCTMSHAGPAGIAQRGEFYRADHPLVQHAPQWFVDAGTPENEWGVTPFDRALAETEAQNRAQEEAAHQARVDRANRNPVKLGTPGILKATDDILDLERGRKVLRGSRVFETDPLAVEHPTAFKPV
jgi:hypothetical protein